jgi:hypothetical protein
MLTHGACLFPTSKSLKSPKDKETERLAVDTCSFPKTIADCDVKVVLELAWAVLLREYTGESYVSFGVVAVLLLQTQASLVHYQLESSSYSKNNKRDAAYELENQQFCDLHVNTAICFCGNVDWKVGDEREAVTKPHCIEDVCNNSILLSNWGFLNNGSLI